MSRLPFILDCRRWIRKRGENWEHLLADVRESVAHAGRYRLLDSIVAVRRRSSLGDTQLLYDTETLSAGSIMGPLDGRVILARESA